MIPNPTSKGKTTEAIILAALVRLGKSVLIPWGEERYDYLVPLSALTSPNLGFLRVDPACNGQSRNIRWARDFELERLD